MLRIRDIAMGPEQDVTALLFEAAKILRISASEIQSVSLVRRSVDARKKPDVKFIYTVDVTLKSGEGKILKKCGSKKVTPAPTELYKPPKRQPEREKRPVVIGFGPAGMFAALILSQAGQRPIVLERGEDAISRHEKVAAFWKNGTLDAKSNVQFGEGGAGTFSDGKLNTGVSNPRIHWILEQFVAFGARENILYDAKPHVGTDVLLEVVQNLRRKIIALGGEVRFQSRVTDFLLEGDRLSGVKLASGEEIPCDRAILAIGHSARDTFETLLSRGIPMEPKPFAMGVRIEQRQEKINEAQYGGRMPICPRGLQAGAAPGGRNGVYLLHVPRRLRGGGSFGRGPHRDQRHELRGPGRGECQCGPAGDRKPRCFSGKGPLGRDVLAASDRAGCLSAHRQLLRPCPAGRGLFGRETQQRPRHREAHLPSRCYLV